MAVAANVRLVRCPKCENLLPELPDLSVYKCGGYGAVLKAKKNVILEDGLQKMFDDVRGTGISGAGSIMNASEVAMKSADETERDRVEFVRNNRVASNGSTMSRAEIGEVIVSSDVSRRGKQRVTRLEHLDGEYDSYSRGVRNRNQVTSCNLNVNRPVCVKFHGEDTFDNIGTSTKSLRRSRSYMDQWGVKSKVAVSSCLQGSIDNCLYHDEGISCYDMNSYYEQVERTRCRDHDLDGLARVENLENDRAGLLRKIDELRDQLSRSCDVLEKCNRRIGTDRRMVSSTPPVPCLRHHAAYVQEDSTRSHVINRQPPTPDDIAARYISQTSEFIPCTDRYGSNLRDPYRQSGYTQEFLGYANTCQQEMFRRPPRHQQSQYMHGPYHEHFHGYCEDVNHDLFMLRPHDSNFHPPSTCGHSCNKNCHLPSTVHPSCCNRRSRNDPYILNYHHRLNSIRHGPRGCSSRGSNLHTLKSRQYRTLNPTVPKIDGVNHRRPRNVAVAQRSGQMWYPIAGGAPFIACTNCFELLKLPRKHISFEKSKQKMKCGACSSLILFELRKKDFIVSGSANVDHVSTEIDDGSRVAVDENANVRYWHCGLNCTDRNACSNDNNDSLPEVSPTDEKSNSAKSDKNLDPRSSTFSLSEDEQIPENLASGEHGFSSREVESFPHPELSPNECPDHSSDNIVVNQFDKRNESKGFQFDQSTFGQNSVKDEIEMDCVSLDSVDKSKDDPPMESKGAESFLAGLIKKGFRDFAKSNQNMEVGQVFVNGHLIPDRVVKKAEKLAGPIQPGDYWYDIRAGFWGVMGHRCLGIIMPNIEEFNYPLPENCAAGNTGVFVNGHELHHKDLDLLASRGLPNTRDGSYLIEISGKVVDEHTGEELDSLGKLAPTVERTKCGFGMKVP